MVLEVGRQLPQRGLNGAVEMARPADGGSLRLPQGGALIPQVESDDWRARLDPGAGGKRQRYVHPGALDAEDAIDSVSVLEETLPAPKPAVPAENGIFEPPLRGWALQSYVYE